MDQVLEVVKQITVFVLIFSVVSNLFSQSKYHRYFTFVEGLIVILLVMTPLLSWFTSERFLEQCLRENVIQVEREFEADELHMIGKKREEMLSGKINPERDEAGGAE